MVSFLHPKQAKSKIKMAFRKSFVLSDESINTYGFWILLSGMDLAGIQANCPLYYEHRTWEIPCGHVENIKLKDGKLIGDVVIDGGNDIEREYIRKIQNGDIKGVSMGIDPVEWSTAPEYLKQGQTVATLIKSSPFEVSLAPLPGNKNALALRNNNSLIELSSDKKYDFIPELNPISMKKIAVLLGMAEDSTEVSIEAAVKALQLKAGNVDKLKAIIAEKLTVNLTDDSKAFFKYAFDNDIDTGLQFLNVAKEKTVELSTTTTASGGEAAAVAGAVKKDVKASDLIQLGKKKDEAKNDPKDCYDYLQKHDPVELARIKNEEPERYVQLQADYGKGVRYKG